MLSTNDAYWSNIIPTINLGNPPKVFVKEWLQNNCLSVIFYGVNNNISQKNN